jgi:hypothetical protein
VKPGAPSPPPPGPPAGKPLAWHYRRLLEQQQAMEMDPEVRAFKAEWEAGRAVNGNL